MLHWDGKLLPEITGSTAEKVERLPIVVTQEGVEQLIGVPKLKSGRGNDIAIAVFEELKNWRLTDKIQAVCFDTAATNTGDVRGAAKLFEEKINRVLLYLPCRHHIFELVLKEVFLKKVLGNVTVGPQIPLLERFKTAWNTIKNKDYNPGIIDEVVKAKISKAVVQDILNFCEQLLMNDFIRDDYKEFVELVVIFLGGKLKNGNKFRMPGASHHARWMAKAIYALKIFLFREHFRLSAFEKKGLRDVCIFLVCLYVKVWFQCSLSTLAPNNDLKFIQESIKYHSIDAEVSDIALNKMSNHLWYLSSETVAFAFFDASVPIEVKRKMVKALDTEKPYCKRFFTTKEVMKSSYANKCLSEFVSSNTKKFIDRFNIEVDFLETDPATWIENEEYQESAHKCREIRVVNDTAERCVQLFSTYNRLLTKDE